MCFKLPKTTVEQTKTQTQVYLKCPCTHTLAGGWSSILLYSTPCSSAFHHDISFVLTHSGSTPLLGSHTDDYHFVFVCVNSALVLWTRLCWMRQNVSCVVVWLLSKETKADLYAKVGQMLCYRLNPMFKM